jgi:PAS domain S-box-containing protein
MADAADMRRRAGVPEFALITGEAGLDAAGLDRSLVRVIVAQAVPLYVFWPRTRAFFANTAYLDLRAIAGDGGGLERSARRLDDEITEALHELSRAGAPASLARSLQEPNGRHFRVVYAALREDDGAILALAAIHHDVSVQIATIDKLRVTRDTFNDVLRSASDWVWETDEKGTLTFVSDRITEIAGRPPAMLLGKKLTSLGEEPPDVEPPTLGGAMAGRAPFRRRVLDVAGPDGKIRRLHVSAVPYFRQTDGQFAGFRGTGTDVSDQHVAERASAASRRALEGALAELHHKNLSLDLALEQAEAAARAKGEFLANMSHELRAPLNAIIGFADIIAQRSFGDAIDRYSEYARDILTAGRHLLNIINDILDVSRLESTVLKADPAPTPLDAVIGESLAIVSARALARGLTIERPPARPEIVLFVDHTRALQILVDLLANAVKFTPSGGRVGIAVEERGANQMAVSVWDTGPGIARDKQEAIFTPFFQIHDDTYSRPHEGVGLGLSIARDLARLMNGDLTVQSEPGQGARFTVTFPRHDGAASAASGSTLAAGHEEGVSELRRERGGEGPQATRLGGAR